VALREREFGVEIECNMGYGGYYGGSIETARRVLTKEVKAGRLGRGWLRDIHGDGSGVEICSPRLSGADGFRQLKRVMSVLQDNGGNVTYQDGLHVHHNAPEFKGVKAVELRGRIADSWINNEAVIQSLVSSRRRGLYHCPPLNEEAVQVIKDGRYMGTRHSLNLRSIQKHGSIEIRLHEGTLDFDQAKAWIRFGQAFIESVLGRKNPIPPVSTTELLRIVRTAETAQRRLLSRRGAR
jgi:hypothetical protein